MAREDGELAAEGIRVGVEEGGRRDGLIRRSWRSRGGGTLLSGGAEEREQHIGHLRRRRGARAGVSMLSSCSTLVGGNNQWTNRCRRIGFGFPLELVLEYGLYWSATF